MAENLKSIEDVKEFADELKSRLSERDNTFEEMEKIFTMDWEDKPDKAEAKFTVSPDPRNAALGAIRLMVATDPQFSIPYNKSEPEARKDSERLEKLAASMWYASGKTMQIPAHYDTVTSGVVYGEAHLAVVDTQKAMEQAKGASKGAMKRLERAARRSPYQFVSINPKEGYPHFDTWGLSAYYRRREVYGSEILDTWGSAAKKVLTEDDARYTKWTYCDLWDPTMHAVWVEDKDKPIYIGDHDLPVMPIAAQIIDGSNVFEKEEHKRQPFLYTVWKSGLWERQNLWLTVFYTLLFEIGNGPTWIYEATGDTEPQAEESDFGGYYKIRQGESMRPAVTQIFDPNMMNGKEVADQKVMESTLYRTALGEPVGASAPYSMVSLLHHAGRLPLVSQQRRGGWVIGQAMEIAFELMKEKKETSEILTNDNTILEMNPEEIPENVMVEGRLEISLPQDNRLNAMTYNQLTQAGEGQSPAVSHAWARENILNIGQSDEMDKEIWSEKTAQLEYMREYQRVLSEIQKMMQQGQMQQPGVQPAPGGNGNQPAPQQQQQQPAPQQQQQPPGGGGIDLAQLASMPPEQVRAILTQQGIPPAEQDAIMQQIAAAGQGGMGGQEPPLPGMGAM